MIRTPARQPVRAALLAQASRLVVLALLVLAAGVVAGGGLLPAQGPLDAPADDRSRTEDASEHAGGEIARGVPSGHEPEGVAHSTLLEGVFRRVAASDVRLIELATGAPREGFADARVVLAVPRAGSDDLERIVDDLARAGVNEARVRSLAPVPEGSRLDLEGRVRLPSRRLRGLGSEQADRAASGLAALVAHADAELVRLDMPERDAQPVRLTVRGTTGALVATVAELERGHTSPLRVEELRVTAAGEGLHELGMRFLLRPEIGVDRGADA